MRALNALPLLVVVFVSLLVPASHSFTVSWYPIPGVANADKAYLVDYDGDGSLEVLTKTAIVSGGSTLSLDLDKVFRADMNLDGWTEVVGFSGNQLLVFKPGEVRTYTINADGEFRVWAYGFSIGHTYMVNGTVITAGENAVPIVFNGTPAVVEGRGDGIYLVTTEDARKLFPISGGDVVTARSYGNVIEVLVTTQEISVLFRYDSYTGTVRIMQVQVPYTRWGTWLPLYDAYLLATDNTAYLLYPNGTLSILGTFTKLIYPVATTSSFIMIEGNRALLYIGGQLRIAEAPFNIDWADYYGGAWLLISGGIVFSDTLKWSNPTWFTAWLNVPTAVYAGDSIDIEVGGNFSTGHLTVGTTTYTVHPGDKVSLTVERPGTVPVSLTVCGEVSCITRNATITVVPKPLNITVLSPSEIAPYSKFQILVSTEDAITGENIASTCSVTFGNQSLTITAPTNVTLVAVPASTDVTEIGGSVTCSASGYSEATTYFSVKLNETYVGVKVTYAGTGRFYAEVINKFTGELLPFTISISVDGTQPEEFKTRGIFTVPPGEHRVDIVVTKNEITLYRESLNLTYYPTVFSAPTTVPVYVADRVTTTTISAITTRTVTQTMTEIRTVSKVDIPLAIGLLGGGVTAGIVIGLIVFRGSTQRKGGIPVEEETVT